MQTVSDRPEAPNAIRNALASAIFISLELSRSTWLITSLSPREREREREKMSKHSVPAGTSTRRWRAFWNSNRRRLRGLENRSLIIVIQEVGWTGFWIHCVLQNEGMSESHVVDPASIATSRRRRRAKTDRIDGEALLRTLLAYKRGEPRVCAMVKAPTPEEETAADFVASARSP